LRSIIDDSIFWIETQANRFASLSKIYKRFIGDRFDRQPEENNSIAPPAILTARGGVSQDDARLARESWGTRRGI